ncbi:MAG: hypothetical protein GY795_08895 [Desulfobacterales bacterium]|nr:hypothetical protein [Desulfobacterales bacterium]
MIQSYFEQIKTTVDQYSAISFVLETKVNFEIRPGGQGYLTGKISFADGSELHFTEYLDQDEDTVDKLMYTYHYQDVMKQLIFRYDNARHQPILPSLEHKHTPEQIINIPAPSLDDVLAEVFVTKGWM